MKGSKMKKILYLSSYPFPAIDGGKQCLLSHIKEIEASKYSKYIKYLFFSWQNESEIIKPNMNIDYQVLSSKFSSRPYLSRALKKFLNFFSPYTYEMIRRVDVTKKIEIKKEQPSIIILDNIHVLPSLPKKHNYKLIYIAHNIGRFLNKRSCFVIIYGFNRISIQEKRKCRT